MGIVQQPTEKRAKKKKKVARAAKKRRKTLTHARAREPGRNHNTQKKTATARRDNEGEGAERGGGDNAPAARDEKVVSAAHTHTEGREKKWAEKKKNEHDSNI